MYDCQQHEKKSNTHFAVCCLSIWREVILTSREDRAPCVSNVRQSTCNVNINMR